MKSLLLMAISNQKLLPLSKLTWFIHGPFQASLQLCDGRFHFGFLLRLFADLLDLLQSKVQGASRELNRGGKTQVDTIYL